MSCIFNRYVNHMPSSIEYAVHTILYMSELIMPVNYIFAYNNQPM